LPNPERDFTELQWYREYNGSIVLLGTPTKLEPLLNRMDVENLFRYLTVQGKQHSDPQEILRLTVTPLGKVLYQSTDHVGFVIKGNNPERVQRVLRVFGVHDVDFLDVDVLGAWQSPGLVSLTKSDELDHYNLTGPYDWWTGGGDNEYTKNDDRG
jgi:hypothetical protein